MASNTVIQTNVLALNSHRNLKTVGTTQSKSSQKLSSGYRINSAADDAAGLAISEKMRAQIRGLDQASRNAQDGISLIQTAEGGMQEIDNMVQRIRELVVQAANDTNEHNTLNDDDRDKIQLEINELVKEVDAMSQRVEFNKKVLLDGKNDLGVAEFNSAIKNVFKNIDDAAYTSSTGNTAIDTALNNLHTALGATEFADVSTVTIAKSISAADFEGINSFSDLEDLLTNVSNLVAAHDTIAPPPAAGSDNANYMAAVANLEAALQDTVDAIKLSAASSITTTPPPAGEIKTFDGVISNWASSFGTYAGDSTKSPAFNTAMTDAGTKIDALITAMTGGYAGDVNNLTLTAASVGAISDADGFIQLLNDINAEIASLQSTAGGTASVDNYISDLQDIATDLNKALEEMCLEEGLTYTASTATAGTAAVLKSDNLAANFGTKLDGFITGLVIGSAAGPNPIAPGDLGDTKFESILTDIYTKLGANLTTGGLLDTNANVATDYGATAKGLADILGTAGNSGLSAGNIDATIADIQAIVDIWSAPGFDAGATQDGKDYGVLMNDLLGDLQALKGEYETVTAAATDGVPAAGPVIVDPTLQPTQTPNLDQGGSFWFQIGANSAQGIRVEIKAVNAEMLGLNTGAGTASLINVAEEDGEVISDLLDTLDTAVSLISAERAKLGAVQNRLEYTINSLDISSENLSAAESRIRDTDMAKEMMNLTKANVLQQAATSMLAQANQAPQSILQLLG